MIKIPLVGFGMWQLTDETACKQAVNWALEAGYRHFDTAQFYKNEQFLGQALQESKYDRTDIFITTKINPANFGKRTLLPSLAESLHKLQTDYVDLLLLHFPLPLLRNSAWDMLIEAQAEGRAKQIGVSNYTIRHLEALKRHSKVVPAVNQVELHVFLQQPDLLKYCKDNNILVEAYSPLAHGKGLDNPVLQAIGSKYGKTAGQVMLRWCVEAGTVPLPKSTHQNRITENYGIFDFSFDDDDKQKLLQLDSGKRTILNPKFIP